MQPMYRDHYDILKLVSGQPLDPDAQVLYHSAKIDPKWVPWWMGLKQGFLCKINALKRYGAYAFRGSKVLKVDTQKTILKTESNASNP